MDPRAEDVVGTLVEAVTPLGLTAATAAGAPQSDFGADLVLTDDAGIRMIIEVKRVSTVTAADAARALSHWSRSPVGDELLVLVADRVTQSAQQVLREAGVGWLDLRGHVRLAGPGVLIDTDVPPVRPRPERTDAFRGNAGLEVACKLLLDPFDAPGVRPIARALGRSASTVSEVLKALRSQHLIKADNRPLLPDLFWETANAWQSQGIALANLPQPGQGPTNLLLELGLEQIESTRGWALSDTMAAVAYGAPVGVKSDYPPDFYVPTQTIALRAQKLLGTASGWQTRAMTVRVAPVSAVCTQRVDLASQSWPVVHPVFAALDLARDPARGREVLEGWTPPEPWNRVW